MLINNQNINIITEKEMHCYVSKRLNIRIRNDRFIEFEKCCVLSVNGERLSTISFDDFYNLPNIWKYLEQVSNIIPQNHNYKIPERYPIFCNHSKICNYANHQLQEIQVEIFGCNLNCIMCPLEKTAPRESVEMYWHILNLIKNHNLYKISPTAAGEPFLQKNKMIDYICSLTNKDTQEFDIITNATLLNKEDIIKIAEATKRNNIILRFTVSCDSKDKNTYLKIRKNATPKLYEKVIENIFILKEYNLLNNINIVIQPENAPTIYKDIEFWKNNNINFRVFPIRYMNKKLDKIIELIENIKKDFPDNFFDS